MVGLRYGHDYVFATTTPWEQEPKQEPLDQFNEGCHPTVRAHSSLHEKTCISLVTESTAKQQ